MKRMNKKIKRTIAEILAVSLLLSGCGGAEEADITKNQIQAEADSETAQIVSSEFDAYMEELFRKEVVKNTINLHYVLAYPENYGISEYEVSLGEISLEKMAEVYEELEETEQKLLHFDREKLTREQMLTYDIVLDTVQNELGAKDLLLYEEVLSPTTGKQARLPVILAEYTFRTTQDIEDYLELLAQVDDVFAEVIAFEKKKAEAGLFMPDYAVDAVIEQCEQFVENPQDNYMIEVFDDRIESFAYISQEEKDRYSRQNYELVTTEVVDGYSFLIEELAALKGDGTNEEGLCHYKEGKEYYEYLVRTGTGSSSSVKELELQTGNYIKKCMEQISQLLTQNPELQESLADYEFPITEPEAVLLDLKQKIAQDFPELPEVSCTLKKVHPSMEETASPAFYLTTPIDDYMNNTIYLNQSYMGRSDRLNSYTILAHEGYPGHLYQNAYTASCGLMPIRSLFSCQGYTEGWATYVENYAYSISGLEEDLADILAWNNAASLGVYAYSDMKIHYDGWDRKDLASYLAVYGIRDERAVNQVYEIIVEEPANYLNYFIGYLEILNLRDTMKAKMGDEFELKKFHEKFLSAGPAPFYILKDYLMSEVDAN